MTQNFVVAAAAEFVYLLIQTASVPRTLNSAAKAFVWGIFILLAGKGIKINEQLEKNTSIVKMTFYVVKKLLS